MARRRKMLKLPFEHEICPTKGGRNGRRNTLSERSKRRSRLRNEVVAASTRTESDMSQNGAPVEYAPKATMVVGDGKDKAETFANSIHLSLQGKGGVGKSLVASILAQYFNARGKAVRCVDTDPVNRTLFQYKALNVNRLELLREGSIDQRGFDSLMETLLTEDATFIVDNGASTFIPLWSYILENSAVDVLTRAGKRLYVHTVITGGQALLDTLHGFKSLAESTSERN